MGYCANCKLTIEQGQCKKSDIIKYMQKKIKKEPIFHISEDSLEDNRTYKSDIGCKMELERRWRNHEAEIKELSTCFPEVLFKLHGEGEENGDIWDKYFKNGKMQVCKAVMTIPPYDESKLE